MSVFGQDMTGLVTRGTKNGNNFNVDTSAVRMLLQGLDSLIQWERQKHSLEGDVKSKEECETTSLTLGGMRKILLAGLLILGIAVAQETPKNHENLGYPDLSFYQLHGPVKELQTCWDGYCDTVDRFNKFGISLASFDDRKLEVQSDGSIFINWRKKNSAVYKDDLLLNFRDAGFGGSNIEYQYNSKILIQAIGFYGDIKKEGISFTEDYIYKDGVLVQTVAQMYERSGEKGLKWVRNFDKNGLLTSEANGIINYKYTYELDANGNWVKLYRNGRLYEERKMIYY